MAARLRVWGGRAALAYAGGVVVTLWAAWHWGGADAVLRWAAPLWLTPLAAYDQRFRQVPHMAWVAGPALLAMAIAAARGDWALSLMGLVSVAASERWRHTAWQRGLVLLAGLLGGGWLLTEVAGPRLIGAAALLGFWMMFELGWWAGADALIALTLTLLWPTAAMVVAIGIAHLVWALVLGRDWRLPRPLSAQELAACGQPGIPALALAAGLNAVMGLLP